MLSRPTDSRCDIMKFNLKKKKDSNTDTADEVKEEPKKKIKNPITKIRMWFWGSGPPGKYFTKDNPFPPYCLRAKLKRWYYVKYRGYVYYITTLYDKPNDWYIYDKDICPRREVPEDAVTVTNEKRTYHLDLDHMKRGFDARQDYGFTAHDAYMYIKCTKIDEAMKIDLDGQPEVDYKKIIGIVAGVFIAFVIFYMMYMQR